jgi:hypothetical protein
MIREATKEDIPVIQDIVVKLVKDRGWEELIGHKVDKFSVDALLRYHIRHKDAVVLVWDEDGVKGFLSGALLPFLLDIRRHSAHEKVSGGERFDELWKEFQKWGQEQEAVCTVRGCYDQDPEPRLGRIE